MPETTTLTPTHLRLIDLLAQRDVANYLREQTARSEALRAERPDHAPLQRATKAA
ncbi:MAG: hypothetical protein ABIU96_04140 [Rhodanobacter sp.]